MYIYTYRNTCKHVCEFHNCQIHAPKTRGELNATLCGAWWWQNNLDLKIESFLQISFCKFTWYLC